MTDLAWSVTPWTWLIAAAVLAGLEVVTPGAFMIWLAGAAVVTAGISAAVAPAWEWQVAIFVALSVAAVLVARRYFARSRSPASPELNRRADRMVGVRVVVLEPIVDGRGRVQVGDSPWPATGPDLPAGATARILRVDGTTLVVEAV